jgi:hypothetical protein
MRTTQVLAIVSDTQFQPEILRRVTGDQGSSGQVAKGSGQAFDDPNELFFSVSEME